MRVRLAAFAVIVVMGCGANAYAEDAYYVCPVNADKYAEFNTPLTDIPSLDEFLAEDPEPIRPRLTTLNVGVDDLLEMVDVSATPWFIGSAGGNDQEPTQIETCGYGVRLDGTVAVVNAAERETVQVALDGWIDAQGKTRRYDSTSDYVLRNWRDGEDFHDPMPLRDPAFRFTLLGVEHQFVATAADLSVARAGDTISFDVHRLHGGLFAADPVIGAFGELEGSAYTLSEAGVMGDRFLSQPVNVATTPIYLRDNAASRSRPESAIVYPYNGHDMRLEQWTLVVDRVDGLSTRIDLAPWAVRQRGKLNALGTLPISFPRIDFTIGDVDYAFIASRVWIDPDRDRGGITPSRVFGDLFASRRPPTR